MKYMRNNSGGGSCPACGNSARVQNRSQVQRRTAAGRPEIQTECASLPVLVFIQPQVWDCTYTCGQALVRGTLFPALDKPFMGKGGCCNG